MTQLGTEHVGCRCRANGVPLSARKFVRSLNLRSHAEWRQYCKGKLPELPPKPEDIPATPNHHYKNKGWRGTKDWLGYKTVASHKQEFLEFRLARNFVHSLRLKSQSEWWRYRRGEIIGLPPPPKNIPARPDYCYRDKGWISWPDWLGKT